MKARPGRLVGTMTVKAEAEPAQSPYARAKKHKVDTEFDSTSAARDVRQRAFSALADRRVVETDRNWRPGPDLHQRRSRAPAPQSPALAGAAPRDNQANTARDLG